MTNHRVVVIGQGGMGRLYAEALRQQGALAGIVVRTDASAERLRAKLSEPIATSLETLLEQTSPTALAILPTTDFHARFVRAAIARRLPSLVIKPACTLPETAEALDSEAKIENVPVLMAHEGVFQPAFIALEAAIAEGRIGRVRELQWLKEGAETLSGGRSKEEERPDDREGRNYAFVYATAMHELYACNRLAGRQSPTGAEVGGRQFASAYRLLLEARVDYAGGIVGRLRYHTGEGLAFRRGLNVVGERGSVLWLMEPGKSTLKLTTTGPRGREVRDLPYHGVGGSNPATPVVAAWLRSLDDDTPPPEGLADGARALRAARLVTEAAARAARIDVDLDALAGGVDY